MQTKQERQTNKDRQTDKKNKEKQEQIDNSFTGLQIINRQTERN